VKPTGAAFVAVLAAVVASGAAAATTTQVRALASRAADDPRALAALEQIDQVDGRPVDLRRALAGAQGDDLRARLRALVQSGATARMSDPAADARAILAGRRFHETPVPRPLQRPLHWLGRKLRALSGPFDPVVRHIPGGGTTLWTILAALVIGAAAFFATQLARRRSAAAIERARRERPAREIDPARLEREADEAQRRGELELALRLRFRAGLARLSLAKAIPPERSLTSGDVRRVLRVPEFDGLALTFDEVVYGRRPPSEADVEASRAGWPAVLERAARS
jgi:Domain of unknown function (DUF4129)